MNSMQKIMVEKISLNMGTGGPGAELEKALKLLEKISGSKPVQTKTVKRIPTWGIRPGLIIGCKVTLRGKKAEELLGRLLKGVGNKLHIASFDNEGNFAFGIHEYLDVPGITYDASIGIIGFEIAVTLKRPGFRLRRRIIKPMSIPKRHKILKDDAINFMKSKYNIEIVEGRR